MIVNIIRNCLFWKVEGRDEGADEGEDKGAAEGKDEGGDEGEGQFSEPQNE